MRGPAVGAGAFALGTITLSIICALYLRSSKSEADRGPHRPPSDQRPAEERLAPLRITCYPCRAPATVDGDRLRAAFEQVTDAAHAHGVSSLLHQMMIADERTPYAPMGAISPPKHGPARMLTDHRAFADAFPTYPPFLVRTRYGARFLEARQDTVRDAAREAHWGQALNVLGELGLAGAYRLETRDGPATIADAVGDLVANFSFDGELEWAVSALAIYLPPDGRWTNKFGVSYSFDDAVVELTRRPLGWGSSCSGTHVLYALALIIQADDESGVLSHAARQAAISFLAAARHGLRLTQRADGSWTPEWAGNSTVAPIAMNALDAVWVTGHQLDWMALVRPEMRVADAQLGAAMRFVIEATATAEKAEVARNLCAHAHGVRATLRLLRRHACGDLHDQQASSD